MLKRIGFLLIVGLIILTLAACTSSSTDSMPKGAPAPEGELDLAAAAEQLGVTKEALEAALGDRSQGAPGQGVPDFAAVAESLDVSESDLLAALGIPVDGPPSAGQVPGGGQPPANRP